MKLDEAITAALEYEEGVYKVYLDAMDKTDDEAGKRIFKVLCDEEMGHLAYLKDRLNEWKKTGKIVVKELKTSIPSREKIKEGLQDLNKTVKPKATKQILQMELLKKALDAEVKASNFYKDMVSKLDGDGPWRVN